MGFGSWFTRALDVVTPWNRGGELERRRKREEEERQRQQGYQGSSAPGALRVGNAQPNQQINVPKPQVQRPDNLFQGLNQNLRIGQPKTNVLNILQNQDTQPTPKLKPGTVVQPTLKVGNAQNNQRIKLSDGRYVDQIPKTPQQLVDEGLDAGKSWERISRENNLNLEDVKKYSQATRPNYGISVARPKQSLGNRFRDIFDANTEADKYRRYRGNIDKGEDKPINLVNPGNIVSRTPIVGTVTKMLNTGATQIAELPSTVGGYFASKEGSAAVEEYRQAVKSGDSARIAAAKDRMNKAANRQAGYNREQEAAHSMFQKNKGGLFNVGTLYDEEASRRGDIKTGVKDIALPTAVTALDLYTLGKGSAISDAIAQNGLKAGVRVAAPNIGKTAVGNFGSGALNTYSEGGNTEQAIKSGLINSILGLVPDVGLPAAARGFRNRVIPKFFRGRGVDPVDVAESIDEGVASAGAEAGSQGLRPRPIKIDVKSPVDIPIKVGEGVAEDIPVRRPDYGIPKIEEIKGDFQFPTFEELQQIRVNKAKDAADAFNSAARPDPRIEGITPRTTEPYRLTADAAKSAQDDLVDQYASFLRDVGEGNGTQLVPDGEGGYFRTSNNVRFGDTAGKRMTKADWQDEARRQLESGQAEPGIQKAFDEANNPEVQSMLAKGDTTEEAPVGKPIAVKDVKTIPVTDQTVVPTGLPETPGTVRATEATAPTNTKTEQVAAAQSVAPTLPPEVQKVLDNPKQFTKRQVAAARNQRKMARAVAKANEDTADAMKRIETASPAAQSGEGFVQTGEFGKSAQGGAYQKVSRSAEMQQALEETSQMSPADVLQTARKNQLETGGFNRRDIRNIAALFESKRIPRGTPEFNEAKAILKEDGTIWGQTGALRNYTIRRTASADELMNRYESKIYRLADDPSQVDSKLFDDVEVAENTYTQARDDALLAYNRFTEDPTRANAKAYHAAQDAADKADKAAKITEYKVADKILKKNRDIKQVRELEKMANDADLYQMDAVDASMLSGTGTFARNFVNAAVGGAEEGIFGRPAAWLSRKLTGESVGGGVGRGSVKGFKEGAANVVDASKARASNAGINPLKHIKNWATTGNQLGDAVIDSQVTRNTLAHYTQLLKEQGYKGRELIDRAGVMARQDPDNVGRMYAHAARTAAGLGGGITRNNKIETIVRNMISDAISFGSPNAASEATAKLITRMTIGFPTAIGRSTAEGVKRFTLGTPTFLKAIVTKDPAQRALLIKEGIKQAGTGSMVIPPLFYALGANGLITGAYPSDPDERARWEREGITENAIKIGGAYYQLPGYLGAWAVPAMFYASLGRNEGDFAAAASDTAKSVPAILPTDNISNWLDVINGRSDPAKFVAQTGSSAVRAATPGGALLAEVAKAFDPTKNDTTSGTTIENFVDKVLTGIPGASNTVPNKEDDAGNQIKNPNPAQLLFGAQSAAQGEGEKRSAQIAGQIDSSLKGMADLGAFNDPNLKAILDEKDLKVYNDALAGKKVDPSDLEGLQKALVKGVSETGDDTAYLEREQYDSNLTALRLKKQLMEADKTVKPSDIKKIDVAIKRGEIYKSGQVPYDMIDAYQHTSLTEWRDMGDPESDSYDPDMYQKLWALDEQMAKSGVSYKSGSLDKQKYYSKKAGSGRGGRSGSRASSLSSDFGMLKAGDFSPQVQSYETIDQKSGSIPIIRTVRPNIVHKIGSSG